MLLYGCIWVITSGALHDKIYNGVLGFEEFWGGGEGELSVGFLNS